ncbi:MAG: DUF92 domain-containing protein [Gemmatimonadales bacterium]
MIRVLVGALVAGVIAGFARQRGMLSASGQWASFLLGVLAAAAGWAWTVLLIAFFVTSTALTRWRAEEKFRRTERSVPTGRERSARQVLANGGVAVLLALLFLRSGQQRWALGALGALAAASADTWSTEVGTLIGGTPRSIWTARPMAVGMSGGITAVGLLAGLAGAGFIAVLGAALLPLSPWRAAMATTTAGFAGCLADSLAGGGLQSRRYCDRCNEWTERRVHPCGYRTRHRAGIYWVSNDVVNMLATGSGAVMAAMIGHWLAR